jgi:hypothetical protein
MVLLEELDKLKILVASSGMESAIFRLVAQCLNQLRYRFARPSIIETFWNLRFARYFLPIFSLSQVPLPLSSRVAHAETSCDVFTQS